MIQIRPADLRDDVALATIDEAAWTPDVSPGPARVPGSPFFTERTRPEDVLLAAADGHAVGYVLLVQTMGLPSHAHVLTVNGLAVAVTQRRRGVGRLLVEEAKSEARRRGAQKLTLRVLAPNVSARRLYEACGFTVEGVLEKEFLLEGRLVDDVLMAYRVDPT